MAWLLNLQRQVRRVLVTGNGGTGNALGMARGVVVPMVATAAIPLWSVVRFLGPAGCVATSSTSQTDAAGVVIGRFAADWSIVAAAPTQGQMAAVQVGGLVRVLIASDVAQGDYAFPSSTSGQAVGSSTAAEGSFGRFVTSAASSGGSGVVRLGGGGGGGGGGSSPLTTKGDLYGFSTVDARVPVGSNGQVLTADSSNARGVTWATQTSRRAVMVAIDAPTAGMQFDWRWPWAGSIAKMTLLDDASGSVVIDLWKAAYASFPPGSGNTITASAKPTLSSAIRSEDSTLTGWTKAFSAGDTVRGNVDSASGLTRVTMILEATT